MISVAVDTSVLLAVFKGEADGAAWHARLQELAKSKALWVCPVVLAELRSYFPNDEACLEALAALEIRVSGINDASALLAGQIFRDYRKAGGPRKTILPDFLVAAHAAVQADSLAALDRGYLRKYFPKIPLIGLE